MIKSALYYHLYKIIKNEHRFVCYMHTGENWKTDDLETRNLVLFFVIAFVWT